MRLPRRGPPCPLMPVPWSREQPKSCSIAAVGDRGITIQQLRELSVYLNCLCKTGVLKQQCTRNEKPAGDLPSFRREKTRNDSVGKRIKWTKITMLEICLDVIKPAILHLEERHRGHVRKCSWVELVATNAQKPKIFVSHSWAEHFRDFMLTVDHLVLERGLTVRDVLWICTFANNQFELSLGTHLLKSPFFEAADRSEATALFLDRTASSLRRSWCTFELAITTDTPAKRDKWQVRSELALRAQKSIWDISWDEVAQEEAKKGLPSRSLTSKPLMLCTPGGLVGSRRVTSGPLLEALQEVETGRAEASSDVDRRRVMNYIAYSYYKNESAADGGQHELSGIEEDASGSLKLQDDHLAPTGAENTRRLNGKQEYEYEYKLRTEVEPDQFRKLDENIRQECEEALACGGLVEFEHPQGSRLICKYSPPPTADGSVTNVPAEHSSDGGCLSLPTAVDGSVTNVPAEHLALTLAQLRILQSLLEKQFETEVQGTTWQEATQRHLWKESLENSPEVLGKMLPPDCAFAQCFQAGPQYPDVYVVCPWDLALVDIFAAIEWHAEARGLPDRATYYINGLCRQAVKTFANQEKIIQETSTCMLVILDKSLAKKWAGEVGEDGESRGQMSLFCLLELFYAYQRKLGIDFACSTGTVATSHPFESKAWAHGDFDKDVAWSLANIDVKVDKTVCTHASDREKVEEKIRQSPGGVEHFEKCLGDLLPMCSLGPALLNSAYLDEEADTDLMHKIIRMLTELDLDRSSGFLMRLRGTFGETALHVTAAAKEVEDKKGQRCLDLLLTTKMDPNAQDNEGETALHWAASVGNAWAVRMLMRHGANPMIENHRGDNPLDLAQAQPAAFIANVNTDDARTCLVRWIDAWCDGGRPGSAQSGAPLARGLAYAGSPTSAVSSRSPAGRGMSEQRPERELFPPEPAVPALMDVFREQAGKLRKKDVIRFLSKIHGTDKKWAKAFAALEGDAEEPINVEEFLQQVAAFEKPKPPK